MTLEVHYLKAHPEGGWHWVPYVRSSSNTTAFHDRDYALAIAKRIAARDGYARVTIGNSTLEGPFGLDPR